MQPVAATDLALQVGIGESAPRIEPSATDSSSGCGLDAGTCAIAGSASAVIVSAGLKGGSNSVGADNLARRSQDLRRERRIVDSSGEHQRPHHRGKHPD